MSSTGYTPTHPIRLVTAASLFDGHDAAINIMRRILQASGAEVIHLGHDRSVAEIVDCAIEEDAQGIALTSYQGGHVEYLKYMFDLLAERGAGHIRIFAGGGGTILPSEIEELHAYGIERIYSPDDGRAMGLQGMIDDLLRRADFATVAPPLDAELARLSERRPQDLARLITWAENGGAEARVSERIAALATDRGLDLAQVPVLGITGTGGAGKSSLVDELVRRFLADFPDKTMAIISVDPSKRKSGGALLGDRIRMNSVANERVYMRSLATRQANLALSRHVREAIDICRAAGFDLVVVETSGIGQSDTEITEHSDVSLYVMTSEYGAATQLEKIDMLDFADLVAINKFDKPGSLDALRDVRRQVKRARGRFEESDESMPVFGTIASQFGDPGTDRLYVALMAAIAERTGAPLRSGLVPSTDDGRDRFLIPAGKARYLGEIVDNHERNREWVEQQVRLARERGRVRGAKELVAARAGRPGLAIEQDAEVVRVTEAADTSAAVVANLEQVEVELDQQLAPENRRALEEWPATRARYAAERYEFRVRDKVLSQDLRTTSLSGLSIPKVALPRSEDDGEILRFVLEENLPGFYPYTAGVFPLKREGEDPTRMFAGEGGPERTNRRFHYLAHGMPAKRLSTAFDSVTLYGAEPDRRPDIWGKIGNSGVSIATVDDAKKLYSGFDLCHPATSVSMTINGPAPMILAFFMNAAIDQRCERFLREQGKVEQAERAIDEKYRALDQPRPRYGGELPAGHDGLGLLLLGVSGDEVLPREDYERLRSEAMGVVRGTVQADILKEDQAQNTCIFSTEFALRLMGDVQQSFVDRRVRNFYSVSISGYHIAEAGANPISQLAFTLANGFTYVEYYLARGMKIDDFAPNLSFFFSNGMDPEYSVMGRVARRIWARAMKLRYGGDERSQKLKYHIQTSGRSLHAQEIAFNDIRTTLQALYAIYDNCNSLHTNAYDEAITTPTEESVRRAVAIQLVINRELGLAKNENPLQGSYIIQELTDLVEEAVLAEFRRLDARGGVLGAMERMYQRSKIQEESLHYETKKHTGELPIIGVNTFLSKDGSPTIVPPEVIRSTDEEKQAQLDALVAFQRRNRAAAPPALEALAAAAQRGENTFETLLETAKVASLGQMSGALFDVGGRYRRNM